MPRAKNKIIRRLIVLLLILSLITTASILLINFFKGDKIKQMLVTELNKHLTVEVSVEKIEITFLKSFPYASLDLSNIAMKPPANLPEAPGLLHAQKISLHFNLINILTGKYVIRSVEISNASLSIWVGDNGKSNLDIWKNEAGGSSKDVDFDIQRLTLTHSKIYYRNLSRNDDIALHINSLRLRGAIQQKQFLLKANGDFFTDRLLLQGTSIIPARKAIISSKIDIDLNKKFFDFGESTLTYADIPIQFKGKYDFNKNPSINFAVSSEKIDINKLLSLLPSSVTKPLNDYKPSGKLTINGFVKWDINSFSSPRIVSSFDLANGELVYQEKGVTLNELLAKGTFNYSGKKNSEVINIHSFSGEIKSGKFKGSTIIHSLSNPKVNLILNANANLEDVASFLKRTELLNVKGKIIANIKYDGYPESQTRIDKQTSGQVTLVDTYFDYYGNPIRDLNATIELRDNKVYFDGLTCSIGGSDIKTNGYIDNLIGHILNPEQDLHASINLFSDKLILEDILALAITKEDNQKSESIFPPHISFDAVVSVNALTYKKLNTQTISGHFNLNDDVLRGKDIYIKALGGNISANGLINGRYKTKAQIITKATFHNVDIKRLFYEFNEFGQNGLVSKNLKGKANATVDFATSLNSDLTVNQETVEAIADLEIQNGELNDFQPLQALSKFLDADGLRNVKFETLKNHIEVSRKTVLIPQMEIKSSSLNLVGYGTHTFGNDIEYHVNMRFSDLLKSRKKKNVIPENAIEDDGLGKPRLYLKITGPIDDPIVQYDTKAVTRKIVDEFKNEKQVFKDVIKKEFGKKKPADDNKTTTKKPKESTQFDIEWDED